MDRKELEYWCKRIGVDEPGTYRVRRSQILNNYNRHYRLIGYCAKDDMFYYDKNVTTITIIHEMLHKKFPDFSEKVIRELTKIILGVKWK